ncbi:hypothetical protein [Romboutsia ilealis]|uniref:hypothetical protein n=1 Tax=Romboutsia ilealis TaxID=1115758 RepID=UPI00259CCE6E|nr:hypothetical protein [Romboutsia ilealis]
MIIEKFMSDKNGVVTSEIEKSLLDENTYFISFSYINRAKRYYKREVKAQYEIGCCRLEVNLNRKPEDKSEEEFYEFIKDNIKTLFYQVLKAYKKNPNEKRIERNYEILLFDNIYELKNLKNMNTIIQDLVKFNVIRANCDEEIKRYFIDEAIDAY